MRVQPSFPTRQRGAALYVALIFLILLSLLGIVGMQVAAMQERMASNYRATNIAFQRAEGLARAVEQQIDRDGRFIPRAGARDQQGRADDPDAVRGSTWALERSNEDDPDTAVVAIRISDNMPSYTLKQGGAVNERPTMWQISAFTTDTAVAPTSDAAVESVFTP